MAAKPKPNDNAASGEKLDKAATKTPQGREKGWQNLKPAQPGEVRNPEGKNQFTDGRKRVMQQAQAATDKALAILVKQLDSEDQAIAQRAAMALLDRGVGKPVQPNANTDSEGNDIPPPPPMNILPVAAK